MITTDMEFKFAYKIGHNLELSINEFDSLTKDLDFTNNNNYIFSNHDLDINTTGSIVFKAIIHRGYPETLPKKIGFVSKGSKGYIMNKLKALGAKKINLTDQLPNIGQIKYVKNWFIDYGKEVFEIVQYYDQELWSKIDMNLPSKDMKRGIINLKLARSMNNLTDYKKIYDPFAGLGRNAIASFDSDKHFILSDNDQTTEELMNKNIAYIKKYENCNFNVEKIFIRDAQYINSEFEEDFAIVTEGYLTDSANAILYQNQIEKRMYEIKDFWLETLKNWSRLENLKEVVLTLPFFITKEEDFFWDIEKDLPEAWSLAVFKNSNYIFYKRKETRIGHMIIKLIK